MGRVFSAAQVLGPGSDRAPTPPPPTPEAGGYAKISTKFSLTSFETFTHRSPWMISESPTHSDFALSTEVILLVRGGGGGGLLPRSPEARMNVLNPFFAAGGRRGALFG